MARLHCALRKVLSRRPGARRLGQLSCGLRRRGSRCGEHIRNGRLPLRHHGSAQLVKVLAVGTGEPRLPPDFGQLALRGLLSAPDHASGCPGPRPASADQPLGPLWPATQASVSTQACACGAARWPAPPPSADRIALGHDRLDPVLVLRPVGGRPLGACHVEHGQRRPQAAAAPPVELTQRQDQRAVGAARTRVAGTRTVHQSGAHRPVPSHRGHELDGALGPLDGHGAQPERRVVVADQARPVAVEQVGALAHVELHRRGGQHEGGRA
eukprot:scaffold56425_cov71-Phaeocystis_antarctica.AAC.2